MSTGRRPRGASRRGTLAGDAVGGISAAFVLIPQALAYASVAGMPPVRGLYVAALAPIAAAFLASSPYLGTGPTAVTSLLTFGGLSALAVPGAPNYVALAGLLALMVGAIRILMGMLRWGFLAYLMSQPLIVGFTSAAGIVIIAAQVPTVLGNSTEEANPFLGALDALTRPSSWHPEAIAVAAGVAAIMVLGRRVHQLFPGVLVAVILGVVVGDLTSYGAATVGEVPSGMPPFSLDLPWGSWGNLLAPALAIAVIGFSEPAVIARHYATIDRVPWNPNRELMSQGLANLVAGIGGGFPAGGSFTRSALVRSAGARTRMAGGITGLVVLLMLPFTGSLSALPVAVLGASVIVAVVGLIQLRTLFGYFRFARMQFAVGALTFLFTIALAPHVERALIIGVLLAVAVHLWRELRLSIPTWVEGKELHLQPRGVLYFASAPDVEQAFLQQLSEHPESDRLVVHLDGLGRVDLTGALVLRDLLRDAREAGLEVEVIGVPPQARKIVERVVLPTVNGGRAPPDPSTNPG